MSRRAARTLALIFFAAYTLALTYPGFVPFNRIRPFVLGLPFSFFWVVLWVAASLLVLWILHHAETTSGDGEG